MASISAAPNSIIAKVSKNYIYDDVVFSILSKLPIKSLKRFQCVRKSWSLLFQDSRFMTMFCNKFLYNSHDSSLLLQAYLPYNGDNTYFTELYSLFGERYENMTKLDWPNISHDQMEPHYFNLDTGHQYDPSDFEFFGFTSINGILCLLRFYDFPNVIKVVLWNPATKGFKIIPPSSVELCLVQPHFLWFHFCVHGFGYDHVTDDYKVIRHVKFQPPLPPHDLQTLWEIYSLKGNSWRTLNFDMPTSYPSYNNVYMSGLCHWLHEEQNLSFEVSLVSFQLSNETFLITPIPCIDDDFGSLFPSRSHLAVLNGSITLMSYRYQTTTFHISILGELGVKESWTKLFVVGPLPCAGLSFGLGKKAEIIFIRSSDCKLTWLDLSTHMVEEFGDKKWRHIEYVHYQESLLPIEGIDN